MARIRRTGNEQRNASGPQGGKRKREYGKSGSDQWDDVCSICDDGGSFLCCEGRCLRSFHPTEEEGKNSGCRTLGLTEKQWRIFEQTDVKKDPKFVCKNCKYNQHQCFSCGLLGSSNLSSGAEVFQCEDKQCGHFYHPKCVARLLYPDSDVQALHFQQQIAEGQNFRCPMHKCHVCKGGENKYDKEMQFALCRSCPTAYHRKCLPSDIAFKSNISKGTMTRAWDCILPNQILIYCMKHEILPNLGTPERNHIVFPDAKSLLTCDPLRAPDKDMPPDHPSSKSSQPPQETVAPDHPSSKSSQPPQETAETGNDPCFSSNGFNSFAPKSLFPLPYPGSCGWLDD
ncbi:hypothetical protein ABZP36_010576 [Zizania latifolia]